MNQINNNEMEGRALRPANRSAMSKYAKAEHKRAAKALGYGLTLGDDSAWFSVSAVWQARLTPQEAATVACAAILATDSEFAESIAYAVLEGAGAPLPAFFDIVSEAGFWADMATPQERAAYAVACFNRFSPVERDEFRDFAGGR